ncbi:hypothetical protein ML401_38780 [Bradyrhizobium sp. 62B]|nr:hypothetical protein ML401_38780 [Bradyrhizobium sp. 62B]
MSAAVAMPGAPTRRDIIPAKAKAFFIGIAPEKVATNRNGLLPNLYVAPVAPRG